jgi:hypothetical protein
MSYSCDRCVAVEGSGWVYVGKTLGFGGYVILEVEVKK